MKAQKPSLPKGTRDFPPEVMIRRNFILDHIRKTFQKFGFLPLETPSIEQLDVLTGKYGEEGDQLIFKILNSGDYLKDISPETLQEGYKKLTPKISEKALRYDLTVPFARFVTMNRGTLSFPFKRYQIQPVWRGDRPQKGRYREFYQCDADVVGTDSLICEAEIILMINEVMKNLGIKDFHIKFNNRKILTGIAETIGEKEKLSDLCVALDKLDKIGTEKVLEELVERGFSESSIQKVPDFLKDDTSLESIKNLLKDSSEGQKGVQELENVLEYLRIFTSNTSDIQNKMHLYFDATLARGLSYYTGAIFEVKVQNSGIGSISGGGRYDNLTGAFGMPDMSGVGFSFGVDRIYDVMEALNLFPEDVMASTQVMFSNLDEKSEKYALPILADFRKVGISAEIYPNPSKLNKQMKYANSRNIPYVIIIGSEEMENGKLSLKDMKSGEQLSYLTEEIKEKLLQKI